MSDLETFRKETRAWLEKNCPPEMRKPMQSEEDICWGGRKRKLRPDAQREAQKRPVPGPLRAERGGGSRGARDESRGQGRSFPRQRPESLDLLRRQGGLDLLPGTHGFFGAQAPRDQLHPVRHGIEGGLDQTDPAHFRQVAVL